MAPAIRRIFSNPSLEVAGAVAAAVLMGLAASTSARSAVSLMRDQFMIEATDVFGRQAPGLDWQGFLDGKCYTCCLGRGPKVTVDMYRKEVDKKKTEDEIKLMYTKQAKASHAHRKDVKERDVKRLRSQFYDDLNERWGGQPDHVENTGPQGDLCLDL